MSDSPQTPDGGGLRPIDPSDFAAVPGDADAGPAPMLQWVAVADLVVDDRYQRPVYGAGRQNVRRIAERFRWSKFAPLIVSPVAGGKFAVIDGQHRATAAALRGITSVPAQVVIAGVAEQAEAFRAVNGQVTRVNSLALQHAAVSAGNIEALAVQSVAEAAGVTILRYPKAALSLEPGETLALGAIKASLAEHGREATITALTCVTETDNNKPGLLNATVIKAVTSVLGDHPRWRDAGEKLLTAFDGIDLESELDEARVTRRPKGTAVHDVLAGRLMLALNEALGGGEGVAGG